ncbi:MAG: hypothetical protein ACOCXS_03255 [Bacteroidota bacterium]
MSTRELNWHTWLKEGDQFIHAATPKNPLKAFRPEIRYNLLSMAFESYVMAILDFFNTLPDNHTFTDLFLALDKVMLVDKTIKQRILNYENIQSICSVEQYHTRPPEESELDDLRDAIMHIKNRAYETCQPEPIL